MNTEQFLSAILPTSGNYFLAIPYETKGYKHVAYTDISVMAAHAASISNKGHNVFFACASYEKPEYTIIKDGEEKKKYRTVDNAQFARSQWLDLDGDQRTNIAELLTLIKITGLPKYNLLVNSGNGVHVYWTFDQDVPKETWRKVSVVFKAICAHYKLGQADTSRTADIASVLRPIGTNNDKSSKGLGVKPVQLFGKPNTEPTNFNEWVRTLVRLKKELAITISAPTQAPVSNINDDLGGSVEYRPTSAARIAEQCNQIRMFRDNCGVGQTEPLWRKCLGVLKFTTDGYEMAQEWSSGHPAYNYMDTKEKLENWNSGPASCASFKEVSPEGCAGCEFNIKSPIRLDELPPAPAEDVAYVTLEGEEVVEAVPTLPEEFEGRFSRDASGLWGMAKREDGTEGWVHITSSVPEIIEYYRDMETGQWKAIVKAHIRPGVVKTGEIEAKVFGQGGSQLLGALASNLLVSVTPGKTRLMENYMHLWLENIKREQNETAMFSHMGWYDDGSFLFGDRQYMPSGEIRTIKLKPALRTIANSMVSTGDLNRYKDLIDRAYNHPGHEEFQFTWLAGFASVLLHIIHPQPIGIVFNAWSRVSGAGKSTASKLAVGIWGKPDIVDADGTTPHALTLNAGMRRNLPMVLDEATNWKGERIGEFAYRYSSGRAKEQGKADGGLRDNSDVNWCNILLTSGNKPMSENMAMIYSNAAPQMARIWQYRFTENYTSSMTDVEGAEVFQELMNIYGVAGEVFLPYVVQHRAALFDELNQVGAELMEEAGMARDGRNWKMGAACVLVAARIAKDLGLHKFDMKSLRNWTVLRLGDLKSISKESVKDMGEVFGSMVAELHAGFIVTNTMGDLRTGAVAGYAPGYNLPKGSITGRVSVNTGEMFISTKSALDWCKKNDVSYNEMKTAIGNKGWLKNVKMIRLGSGTTTTLPATMCFCLDAKAFGHLKLVGTNEREDQLEEAV